MAELGAVASVVQLVDVALRTSGEVCKFLDAYKSADRDVMLLYDTLRDVEANIRNLRGYVIRFQRSKAALEEYENLSETIMGALKGYDADICAVKLILPRRPLEKVKEKARWALKKRETQELIGRITQRNSNLTAALGIMESQQSLHIRNNTQDILAKQTAFEIAALRDLAEINSKVQEQKEDHAELSSWSKNIANSIHSIEASSTRQHKTLTSIATQQAAIVNDRLDCIDKSSSRLARNTQKTYTKLDELSIQVQQSSKQTQQTMDALLAGMRGIHAKATFSVSSVDTITKIVREEIRTTLTPIIEEAFNHKQTQREEALRRLEDLNDTITHEIGSDISVQRTIEASDLHVLDDNSSAEYLANQKNEEPWRTRCDSNTPQSLVVLQDSTALHYTVSTYKRRWSRKLILGLIEVEIRYTNQRLNGSPQSTRYTSVTVHFWPTQTYLTLPRISAFYSTAPTLGGYYQLAPTIAVRPVLPDDHLVFQVIQSGDLLELQKMFTTGQIHLRSCDSMGRTLLHSAAWHLNLDICKFLNDQGLSWYKDSTEIFDPTPYDQLLFTSIRHPWRPGILGTLSNILDAIDYKRDYGYADSFWLSYYYACGSLGDDSDHAQFEQDFRRRWPDRWDEFKADALAGAIMGQGFHHSPYTIKRLLQSGVNPNMVNFSHAAPLALALSVADFHQDDPNKFSSYPYSEDLLPLPRSVEYLERSKGAFGVPSRIAYERYFPCITELIIGGADIYYIHPSSFDWAEHWSELASHSEIVMHRGIYDAWMTALEWSGRDPDCVFLEDERRRKQAFRLYGATRSGVDETILDPPSIEGLRCRKCRRRFCDRHDFSIFHQLQ